MERKLNDEKKEVNSGSGCLSVSLKLDIYIHIYTLRAISAMMFYSHINMC